MQLTCSCGTTVEVSGEPASVCPRCGRALSATMDAPPPGRSLKPLWALMGESAPTPSKESSAHPASAVTDPAHSTAADSTDVPAAPIEGLPTVPVEQSGGAVAVPYTSPPLQARGKGLWGLMQHTSPTDLAGTGAAVDGNISHTVAPAAHTDEPPPTRPTVEAGVDEATAKHAPSPPRPKGLWSLIGPATHSVTPTAESPAALVETPPPRPIAAPSPPVVPHAPGGASEIGPEFAVGSAVDLSSLAAIPTRPVALRATEPGRSATALAGGVAGLLALPLTALALINQAWTSLPATTLGFAALLAGFVALGDVLRAKRKARGLVWSLTGILCGTAAMLLGPLVVAPLGRQWHQESQRGYTTSHLQKIGEALAGYYQRKAAFPPGGVFRRVEDERVGYHGWIAHLLPFVGQQSLYDQIDLDVPFDHPDHHAVMGIDIPVFHAAGGNRARLSGIFAVTHFAGVGGDVVDDLGEIAQGGLFDANSEVTKEAVCDGLSNTLAVGEIRSNYPAWGDPGNWRGIGKGLNKDPAGFGNAERTGAHFLMADGSVRYFSNATDPKLLLQLSTRNGGEALAK